MLAETRSTDSLASANQPSLSWKNIKDTGPHSGQQDGQYQGQTSEKISSFFGLETKAALIWDNWYLGKKFTKMLVLKNINCKQKTLHIRPPVSKFFSASSHQIAVINPGTSFSLPVTFRPTQMCEYEDSIEFQDKDGSFQVCLCAIIPCHTLEVPDSVKLPLCAVQHSSKTEFLLKNVRKLETFFEWDCAAPFQLSPEQGMLKSGQECHITAVFRPQEARIYQQQARCRFGGKVDKADVCTVHLQGQAKHPYLQFQIPSSKEEGNDYSELHFGAVAVGQSLCKRFDIINPSPVSVSFSLSPLPGVAMFGSQFSCDVTKGKLAPGGSLRASVTYSPAVVDAVSVEYLSLKYIGSINEPQLKLKGKCIGPEMYLSSSVLDFGCVKESGSVVRTVELVNLSPAEAIYQWDIDCGNSVFSILPASGTVLPHSHVKLKAVYRPTHPMAHNRKVSCLILHMEPLFLDLIGTCHSELQQPEILKPDHLVLSKKSYVQIPPVSILRQDSNTRLDQQGVPLHMDETNQKHVVSASPVKETYEISLGCIDSSSSNSSSPSPHVSVVPSELLFNHKTMSSSSSSEFSQFVTIRNRTGGNLRLMWTVAEDSPFSVSPSLWDLAALKSTAFRVTYDAKQLNTLHGGQLECFAYYKDGPDMLRPPWCVTVRVIGHSFQRGKEHFNPSCSLKPPQVVFTSLGVASCRTVLLQNNGDLPLTFCLNHNPNAWIESLSVLPGCGLIPPGGHQIITIRVIPSEDDDPKQEFTLMLQLNAAKFTKELTIVVEKPCVSLESSRSLYFQPTAVGSTTQRNHHIKNLSRLPVQFQWSVPETDQRLICVKPDAGELHPNESSVQVWAFSPLAEEAYSLKASLNFWPIQSDGSNKSHLTLEVTGMGARGSIEVEKAVLDVGEILAGSNKVVEIPLVNNSPCPVSFRLSVQRIQTDRPPPHDSEEDQSALHLDCETGTIASHSTMRLQSTIRLCTQALNYWVISAQILNAAGNTSSPLQKLCEVQAKGVFPTLQAVDVCSGGSIERLSKVHLWKLLSLDSLNEHLLKAPSPAELTFKTPTKHSLHIYPPIFTKVVLDFSFSSAPLNSEASEFMLMFHNPGSFPVEWAFLFPKDQQIELEDWAETGEFSSTELYQMKVQDNQLFKVSPRSGTLAPGQKRAVQFSYSHKFIGTNQLPVVFKLSHGREILLNFQGVTVERDEPYLHFAFDHHVFNAVDVRDFSPPRQMYELHNGGAVPVHYEVDGAVLSQLQMDNFNHPVLRCLSPEGEVLPGSTATLEWIFSPLELKLYQMEVPICIQEKDSVLVRFEGCGTNTSTLGSSDSFTCCYGKAAESSVQREPFPGQVLFLSEDIISLGDIPVSSQTSKIFFITNVSHTETAHFMWEHPQQRNLKVLQIRPERGRLCPEECTLCVLTFSPTDHPTVYHLDLVCQVTQEAAFVRYHDELQRWEEEKERQQNKLIITDKNTSETQRILRDEKPPTSPGGKEPLSKYKILPPISSSGRCEAVGDLYAKNTRAERRLQREAAKIWRRPQPPQPALLHLRVTAHSHGLQGYFKHFPDQCHKYYRTLQAKTQLSSTQPIISAGQSTSAHGPGKDIVAQTLTSMISDNLNDSAFVQPLFTLPSQPCPYQPADTSSSVSSTTCTPRCPPSTSLSSPQPHILLDETMDREEAEENRNPLQPELTPVHMCEAVLVNMLQNLMIEAVRGELDLAAYPRNIILPSSSLRRRQMSRATLEKDQ